MPNASRSVYINTNPYPSEPASSSPSSKKSHAIIAVFIVVLLFLGGIFFLNRTLMTDYLKGSSYVPSSDMEEIRDNLGLTAEGIRIFNATRPRLDSRDEFNFDCDSSDPEIAVYGCYHSDQIYVYDIDNPELAGFRESTTAHELLHAVWARLSGIEKNRLVPLLESVYSSNQSLFDEALKTYPDSERLDELYVRSATQVKTLPTELETHFSEIFTDQDKIVDYYDSYIAPFKEIHEKIESLSKELESKKQIIDQKTEEYESKSNSFNKEVEEFNKCADTEGCFTSRTAFNSRRNELLDTAATLDNLYSELGKLIDDYNVKIDEYNSNILHNNTLQNMINSNAKPGDIE